MNSQYMESNSPYGGMPMGYNQMPPQMNDIGNPMGHQQHYSMPGPTSQQLGNGPPPQNMYPPQYNQGLGKMGQAGPVMTNRPPFPSQLMPANANYQNGSTVNSPSSPVPPHQQQPPINMQGPPMSSNYQPSLNKPPGMGANVPPHSTGPQNLVNQMGNMNLNASGGAPTPRPSLANGPGASNSSQSFRMAPPMMSSSPNPYGTQDQTLFPAQHGSRPPMPGQHPSSFPGQFSSQQHPPPPSAGGQPPHPTSVSGQHLAPPPVGGQHPSPPVSGQIPSPLSGPHPSLPPASSQHSSSFAGQQLPPTSSGQQLPLPGQPQSHLPGQSMPSQPPSNLPLNRSSNPQFSGGTGYPPPTQPVSQIQDFGHRLPSNQPPLSIGGIPGGHTAFMNQQQLINATGVHQSTSNLNQPPVANSESVNGVGFPPTNVPPYSGPPTSHQFSVGATPPPAGLNSHMQPHLPNQYGMQQKYPPTHTSPPSGDLGPQNYNQGYQGYNQMHQSPAGGHVPPMQQQQRRLDPDMMPSPIQVIEDDRKSREGDFCTNLRGQVPPLVTTKFVTQDQGNCNPRFIRSTMYTVPCNPDMMKQTSIPFVLSISPFAKLAKGETLPPIVQSSECGPTRCVRCKAYMCPYMQFIDGGRRFQCNFCRATTEVPPEYFAHLDHTGQRVDKYERPELCLGSYEFIATKDYCKNNVYPLPPAFIFIIDVSYNNIKSGVVQLLCQNMKTILAHLPRETPDDSQIKVGFITYSNTVQFYNLKSCLSQPQVLVVPDVQDMFMPLLDGFLVGLDEAEVLIDNLMEQIPLMYADSRETETILGPVIKAGLEALKAADRSGKLFVFHSSLPIAEAPGKLRNRDERKLLGTEKEKTVLAPQIPYYNQLGQECVAAGCSVDLFTFPNAYIDIATIGQVSRLSGGQIHKYTYFVADVDGERFIKDLCLTVSSQTAFDAIMRVRTSTGIRPVEFYGNYYMSNTTDVELAAADTDKAICTEIKHDDKLTDEEAIYIQAAILYTSVSGQRRLRIHNLSLNTCTQMADLYKNCELDALMNFYSKHSLRQLCDQTPKQVKENLINKCAQGLACYRKNCASPSSAGQLILPECMKLLPLYVNCLLKNDAIGGGSDMTTDDRSFAMHFLNSMDVSTSLAFIYPRLIPLHDLDYNSLTFPSAMRCTFEKLKDNGIYLLENGLFMFMWIGLSADSKWLQNVFGVQSAAQIDIDKSALLELDNPISQGVRQIVNEIREERRKHLKLIVIKQKDKLEVVFRHFLVEDKGIDGSPSYVDFLCHVHKEIRNLLS